MNDILFIVNFSFNQNENKNGPFYFMILASNNGINERSLTKLFYFYLVSFYHAFRSCWHVATGAFYLVDLRDFNELLTIYTTWKRTKMGARSRTCTTRTSFTCGNNNASVVQH